MLQTIEIYRESGRRKKMAYRAVHGQQQAEGKTPGQALDSLEKLFTDEEKATGSLIILQRFQPDAFFAEKQQQRLQDLMSRFQETISRDESLTPEERTELEQLVDEEWVAAIARGAAILNRTSQP
jgi:hypothetical protein